MTQTTDELSVELLDDNLRNALGGTNADWLRAALDRAQASDPIEFALDAAVLASVLSIRASARLEADICRREAVTADAAIQGRSDIGPTKVEGRTGSRLGACT